MDNKTIKIEEEAFSFRGLIYYVLKRWKLFLILLVIGGLIGGGYYIYQKKAAQASVTETEEDTANINLNGVRLFADYTSMYHSRLVYDEASYILHMDPNSIYRATITSYITSDINCFNVIEARYQNIIDSNETLSNVNSASGLETSDDSIRQLINTSFSVFDSESNLIYDSSNTPVCGAVLTITIFAPTEESAKSMLEVVNSQLNKTDQELRASYSTYSSVKLKDIILFGYSSSVFNAQQKAAEEKAEITKLKDTLEKSLTDIDRTYFKAHYDQETGVLLDDTAVAELAAETALGKISKLSIPLFAVGLCFIGFVWFCIRYLTDVHIKSEEEIGEIYGLNVLASFEHEEKLSRVNAALKRFSLKNSVPGCDEDYLINAVATVDAEKLILATDKNDRTQAGISDLIKSKVSKVLAAGNLLSEGSAVKALDGCDGIIILVHIWETRKADFRRTLELAANRDREVSGVIVIR